MRMRKLFSTGRGSSLATLTVWLLAGVVAIGTGARTEAQTTPPAGGTPAAAAVTVSIATLAPAGSTWMRVFDAWNREVRRRSAQTLALRFYAGGVQGDENEVIRKIRTRRLDGAAVTATGLGMIHRPATVFQIPGILRTYEQLDAARDGMAATINPGIESAGFKILGWADVGQSRLFSTSEVRAPADLASKKPWQRRDDPIIAAVFQVIRSNPVQLQVPEVLGALQTSRVDTIIAPPTAMIQLQWSSRMTHMMDYPLSIVIGGTVVSKTKWDTLTAEQQTILTETATQFHALARRNLRNDERAALTTLTQRGVASVATTDAQKEEWRRVGQQVRARLVGQVADQALIDRVAGYAR